MSWEIKKSKECWLLYYTMLTSNSCWPTSYRNQQKSPWSTSTTTTYSFNIKIWCLALFYYLDHINIAFIFYLGTTIWSCYCNSKQVMKSCVGGRPPVGGTLQSKTLEGVSWWKMVGSASVTWEGLFWNSGLEK